MFVQIMTTFKKKALCSHLNPDESGLVPLIVGCSPLLAFSSSTGGISVLIFCSGSKNNPTDGAETPASNVRAGVKNCSGRK